MKYKRGDNAKGFGIQIGEAASIDELEAFDLLGPMTRQALRDSPIKWLAIAIVQQIQEAEEAIKAKLPEWQRPLFSLDLQDPALDRNIAAGIVDQSKAAISQDRSREDAELGVRPLRPRRIVRRMYR